jgi:hypothetical protein
VAAIQEETTGGALISLDYAPDALSAGCDGFRFFNYPKPTPARGLPEGETGGVYQVCLAAFGQPTVGAQFLLGVYVAGPPSVADVSVILPEGVAVTAGYARQPRSIPPQGAHGFLIAARANRAVGRARIVATAAQLVGAQTRRGTTSTVLEIDVRPQIGLVYRPEPATPTPRARATARATTPTRVRSTPTSTPAG